MQISPGSVRTRSVSCTTSHDRRQVYTQCTPRLHPRNDFAPHFRHLHSTKVGPEHIRMKIHPYLACDRVYAVTGQNKPIGLYLSSMICAEAVTGYYFISGLHINGGFTVVRYFLVHSSCETFQIYRFRTSQSLRLRHALQLDRFICRSFHMQSVPHSVSRSLPRHYCQSFTAGYVRRFRIWDYYLVCVFQC